MIFQDNFKDSYSIDFTPNKSKYICPACSTERKKKRERSLYINRKSLIGRCYNCDRTFFEHKESDNIVKEYKAPKELQTPITENVISYFKTRGISESSLNHLRVTSGDHFFPQIEKNRNAVKFNYYKSEKLINVKYRDAEKNFMFETDCEVTFYNYDAIYKYDKIVIVEGEIDALSFIEAGIFNVISLPNGCRNTKFIDQYIFDIERINEWVLCLDKDSGGIAARVELIGKLGIEKCLLINTKDCKDGNSFLQKYGKSKLNEIYDQAEKIIDIEGQVDFEVMLNDAKIDNHTELKPYKILLGEHRDGRDIEILSSGNMSLMIGKAKAGKTYGAMVLCKLMIKPFQQYFSQIDKGIVLFDTEQKSQHSKRFYRRLSQMLGGVDSIEKLSLYCLRGYSKEERRKFIKWYIEKYTPDIAIIDNVRDIMNNFNDIDQSDELLTMLSILSENTETHIMSTIHVNKGDNNARGHIGAELTQKAESVFLLNVDADKKREITPAYTRNEEFTPIQFKIEHGLPIFTWCDEPIAGQQKQIDDIDGCPF